MFFSRTNRVKIGINQKVSGSSSNNRDINPAEYIVVIGGFAIKATFCDRYKTISGLLSER